MRKLTGFAASVPGNGHLQREIPCQDASGVWLSPRPVAIVCDGRGSAKLSHFGARAAVKAFRSQCAVLEDLLGILDEPEVAEGEWECICQLLVKSMCQQKLELAEEYGCGEREFDYTVAFCVWGRRHVGFFQVGDGAITRRSPEGEFSTVFPPDKGEFDNITTFLRLDATGHCCPFHAVTMPRAMVNAVAITSDGPEYLMFHLPSMVPGPIFGKLFSDMDSGELTRQNILDYLTAAKWATDPRGRDDRSLVVMGWSGEPEPCEEPAAAPAAEPGAESAATPVAEPAAETGKEPEKEPGVTPGQVDGADEKSGGESEEQSPPVTKQEGPVNDGPESVEPSAKTDTDPNPEPVDPASSPAQDAGNQPNPGAGDSESIIRTIGGQCDVKTFIGDARQICVMVFSVIKRSLSKF
ncbi:MAG: protein phosphatase 2C domain-containing protein [Victivallaceae bacterium]|nr:protein phosphatase 2C domain-containing protein [Victivallaceae bacterium]